MIRILFNKLIDWFNYIFYPTKEQKMDRWAKKVFSILPEKYKYEFNNPPPEITKFCNLKSYPYHLMNWRLSVIARVKKEAENNMKNNIFYDGRFE